MINYLIKFWFITVVLPFCLWSNDFSLQFGTNHSWLYYPEGVIIVENEFNPNLSLGLNSTFYDINNFSSSYGARLFSVGRFDKYDFEYQKGEIEINHIYLSLPLQVNYTFITKFKTYLNIEPAIQVYTRLKDTGTGQVNTRTGEMNRFNLFLGIGLNYRFNIMQHEFGIGGLVNYGIFRISRDKEFDNGTRGWLDWRAREILLYIEYFFQL